MLKRILILLAFSIILTTGPHSFAGADGEANGEATKTNPPGG